MPTKKQPAKKGSVPKMENPPPPPPRKRGIKKALPEEPITRTAPVDPVIEQPEKQKKKLTLWETSKQTVVKYWRVGVVGLLVICLLWFVLRKSKEPKGMIPKAQYDKVVKERDEATAQRDSAFNEINKRDAAAKERETIKVAEVESNKKKVQTKIDKNNADINHIILNATDAEKQRIADSIWPDRP